MSSVRYFVFERDPAGGCGYAGVDRIPPNWRSDEPASSELNALRDGLAESGDVLNGPDAARVFRDQFRKLGLDVEVIADVPDDCEVPTGGVPIGFDVTYFSHHSMLGRGDVFGRVTGDSAIATILALVHDYFEPRLNAARLFSCKSDAERFRACLEALQQLCPDLFEDKQGFAPEVHVLYRLD